MGVVAALAAVVVPVQAKTVFSSWQGILVSTAFVILVLLPLFYVVCLRPMTSRIDRLKHDNQVLGEREEMLELLLDSSAEAIYGLDREGRCTFCNDACVRMLGFKDKGDLIGRNMHECIHHTREDGSSFRERECTISRSFRNGDRIHLDKEVLWRADGSRFWAEYWSAPIKKGDDVVGAVVNFTDITARTETAEALCREARINETMARITGKLLKENSLEEIACQVLEAAKEITTSEYGFVGFIDEQTRSLMAPTMTGDVWQGAEVPQPMLFPEFKGLWGWALERRQAFYTNSPQSDSRSGGVPLGHIPIERFLAAPAMIGEQLVGIVALANPGRSYTDIDLQSIEKLADIYAIAFQQQRFLKSVKESEARYKELYENNPHAMWIYDIDADRFLDVNDTALTHYGFSREEFLAMGMADLSPEVYGWSSHDAESSGSEEKIWRHCTKDGSIILVEINSHPLDYQGRHCELMLVNDVTGRKLAEEQIRLYTTLVNQSNDAIFVVNPASGSILFANEIACENLGYPLESLLEKKVYEISAELDGPDDWRKRIELMSREGSLLYETTHRHANGGEIPVESNSRIIRHKDREYLVAVVRDLRERKEAENDLFLEKNKLEAVVSALGDGLTVQDTEFRILYQNEIHKQKQGDHLGEYCYRAYQNRDEVCEGCLLAKCFVDGRVHHRETRARTNGETIYLEVSAAPIRDSRGNIVGGIETVRDISARKQLEFQVQQNMKMQALGTLAGGIAHDFNNILTAVIGFGELVQLELKKMGKESPEQEQVLKAAFRAKELVKQILTFCRQADQDIQPVKFDLLLKEALKMLRASLPSTIEIRSRIEAHTGTVAADPTQLHQLILNLCTNAQHAMQANGGVLTVGLKQIVLDNGLGVGKEDLPAGAYVLLEVSDTGHGMDPSVLERIFEPYYTTKKQGEGTGMGLSVVHGIVKSIGGDIVVASEAGMGATFRVYLPCQDQDAPQVVRQEDNLPTGHETILFVDDEENITAIVKRQLEDLGYTVVTVNDSVEARELFAREPDRFDLVITDMTMPKMTGAELTRRILGIRPDKPVILCSGFSEVMDAQKAEAVGARRFLMKPFTRSQVAKDIREVLNDNQ